MGLGACVPTGVTSDILKRDTFFMLSFKYRLDGSGYAPVLSSLNCNGDPEINGSIR